MHRLAAQFCGHRPEGLIEVDADLRKRERQETHLS